MLDFFRPNSHFNNHRQIMHIYCLHHKTTITIERRLPLENNPTRSTITALLPTTYFKIFTIIQELGKLSSFKHFLSTFKHCPNHCYDITFIPTCLLHPWHFQLRLVVTFTTCTVPIAPMVEKHELTPTFRSLLHWLPAYTFLPSRSPLHHHRPWPWSQRPSYLI